MNILRKKIHRFFVPFSKDDREVRIDDPEIVHHVVRVLQMRAGEPIILVHEGVEALGLIVKTEQEKLFVKVTGMKLVAEEPTKHVTAFVAMFKKEPFEWMLEKLTEVGVSEIVPIETARTVRFPWKPERFNAILKESAEQSGRGRMPKLHEPMTLTKAFELAKTNETNVMFEIGAKPLGSTSGKRIGYFIGPEGGWDAKEIEEAKKVGVYIGALGSLTLRAETAAIVAAYELLQ